MSPGRREKKEIYKIAQSRGKELQSTCRGTQNQRHQRHVQVSQVERALGVDNLFSAVGQISLNFE